MAKKLISFGIQAVRLNNDQTRSAIKKLAAAGIVEAKNAARLAQSVSREAATERKIITSFLAKEAVKEWRLTKPHAMKAARRSKRFVGMVAREAKRWSQRSPVKHRSSLQKSNKKS